MKISIVGNAYAITSTIKHSDYDLLKKHCPEALTITDEEGNDVFSINYNAGNPSVGKFGITFDGISRDDKKTLTLTGTIPGTVVDAKEFVADQIGVAMGFLNQMEEELPEVVKSVADSRKQLLDKITIA